MFDPRVDSIISELKRLNQHFCKKVKCCLGISNTGDPNLVLNQQGDWVRLKDVITYSAGVSTIGFTNNGGDSWDVDFKITPDSLQLPVGKTIDSYNANITFYVAGGGTPVSQTIETTDSTKTVGGYGAGVYYIEQTYNIIYGGIPTDIIGIQSIYKVDGAGNILAYFRGKGTTVISTNGININVNTIVEQSENYPIEWYSYDDTFTKTLIGAGVVVSLTLPINCIYLVAEPVLDSVFTTDLPIPLSVISTITIN